MSETALQRRIRQALEREVGGYWYKTHGSRYEPKGRGDLLGCVPCYTGHGHLIGVYCSLEVKRPGEWLEPIQGEHRDRILAQGGIAGRVTSPAEAVELVREALAAAGLSPRLPDRAAAGRRRSRVVL